MDSESHIFQQKVNFKGETEFRTKFGRHKALVLRKHLDFFYIDLYDNRPGKTGHIGLGMDELDALLSMRTNLNALKPCFIQQPNVGNGQTRPPTPPADVFKIPASPRPSYAVERIPLHTIQPAAKRPSSEDMNHDTAKKTTVVYEDISPVKNENTIPQDLVEYLYAPVFQD